MGILGMTNMGSTTYDNLFAGSVGDIVSDAKTLILGQNVVRGAALGKITASNKLTLVNSAAVDGSQVIYAIAADATNATSADTTIPVYLSGEFNQAALVFGGTDTYVTHRDTAKSIGIFFKSNETVGGMY